MRLLAVLLFLGCVPPCMAQPSPSAPPAEHIHFLLQSAQSRFSNIQGEAAEGGHFMATYLFPGATFAFIERDVTSVSYGASVAEGTADQAAAVILRLNTEIARAVPGYIRTPLEGGAVVWAECQMPGRGRQIALGASAQGTSSVMVVLSVAVWVSSCPAVPSPATPPSDGSPWTVPEGRWTDLSGDTPARTFAVDLANVRQAGAYRYAWYRVSHNPPVPHGAQSIDQAFLFAVYDCTRGRYAVISGTHMYQGRLVTEETEPRLDWIVPGPGTVASELVPAVCSARVAGTMNPAPSLPPAP